MKHHKELIILLCFVLLCSVLAGCSKPAPEGVEALKSYDIPNKWNSWGIRFPANWEYEVDYENYNEQIFYPPDSDLTVRITVFSFEKDSQVVPKETIIDVYKDLMNDMEESKIIELDLENCETDTYYEEKMEKGQVVHHILIRIITDGIMCLYHSFATDKQMCIYGASFINDIQIIPQEA